MISNSMSTAASGLMAQRDIVDAIGRNIANAATPGYRRVDVTTQDLGQPFSGVTTQKQTNNQPWVEQNLARSTQELGAVVAQQSGQDQAAGIISNSDVGAAFSAFSTASMNMQQFPASPQYQQEFSAATKRLDSAVESTQSQIVDLQRNYQTRSNLSQIELDSLKSELSKISSRGIDDTNSTMVEQLKQQIASLTGTVAGYNQVINSITPPLLKQFKALTGQLREDIVQAAGTDIATAATADIDFQAINNSERVREFSDQFGALITRVGADAAMGLIELRDSTNKYNAASDEWQQAYGVDIAAETVKLLQAQRLYEANARVLQASDSMLGVLLNAVG